MIGRYLWTQRLSESVIGSHMDNMLRVWRRMGNSGFCGFWRVFECRMLASLRLRGIKA